MGLAAQLKPASITSRRQPPGKSPIYLAGSNHSSAPTRKARERLQLSLPKGWQNFFGVRRAGRHWGLSITCPVCQLRPGVEIHPWQRWRWLSAHIAAEHM